MQVLATGIVCLVVITCHGVMMARGFFQQAARDGKQAETTEAELPGVAGVNAAKEAAQ